AHQARPLYNPNPGVAGTISERLPQPVLAIADLEMLVDDRAGQKIEAGPHFRLGLAAGDHRLALGGGAGARPADHAAAGQEASELALDGGAEVGLGDLRLIA